MRSRCLISSVLLVASTVGFPALVGPLAGQFHANLGRVVGYVTGPDGAAIPGATVVVSGASNGLERSASSDGTGWFQVGSLNPAEYSVTASSPDFAPARAPGVVVSVGATAQVNLELALQETFASIDVVAAALDTALPSSSNVVASQTFDRLPINGRRFHDFALLTPAVQVSRFTGHLSFAAMRGIYTNVTLDGADYNQSFFGGIQGGERAAYVITVPQSAVQEFQAVTAGFTAEYGRTVSGVVNVSTKSGSNEVHGDAFYQIRHPRLGLADPFGARVLERLQQFGGSAGGPLARDRAFAFFAIERQASVSPRYVEFPSLLAADRESGPEAYDYFKSLEGPFEATNDAWALTPRLDWQLAGGGKLMARYNLSRAQARNAVSIGAPSNPRTTSSVSANGTEGNSIHFVTAQLTSLLSPRLVNQFRFTFTKERRPRYANAQQPLVTSVIGEFGSSFLLPTVEADMRPMVTNSLMVHAGAHDFKFGGEVDRIWVDDMFGYAQFGYFSLFSGSPDEVLDILSPGGRIANRFDAPGIFLRQVGNTLGVQRLGHAAVYAQDYWRVAPGLTVDLGFRWAGQFNQAPEAGNGTLVSRVRAASFPLGPVDPTSLPDDLRQWMPRLGFAYAPPGLGNRLVARGSFGVFHAVTPPVFFNAATKAFRDPPFNLMVLLPNRLPTVYRQFLAAGIDLNRHPLAELPVFSKEQVREVLDGDQFFGASPLAVSPAFRNPRSLKYTLSVDYELPRRTVLALQWMRQRATRLHGMRNYNLPVSTVRPDDPAGIPFYDLAAVPAPDIGRFHVVESISESRYDGITASVKRRGARIHFAAHYTYARAFSSDVNAAYFWEPRYTDQGRPEWALGPSELDLRHQVTGFLVVPLGAGLSLSGILRASSAPPLDPAAGTDLNGDRVTHDRALAAPGRYFGRNSFRNRGMRSLDIRVLKEFAVSELSRVELSVEMFNALDFDNVEFGPFNSIYGPGLDLATGAATDPRPTFRRLRNPDGSYDRNNLQVPGTGPLQVQVGMKLLF